MLRIRKKGVKQVRPRQAGQDASGTFAKKTFDPDLRARLSIKGAIFLQGPHHSAKKSTTTNFDPASSNATSRSSSVSTDSMLAGPSSNPPRSRRSAYGSNFGCNNNADGRRCLDNEDP